MTSEGETLTERILRRLRNNWLWSMFVVLGAVAVGIAQFTNAIGTITRFLHPGPAPAVTAEYCALLVPLVVQLDRTKDAFARWRDRNLPLEELTIRDGNQKARDLLEKHGQLVPTELQEDRRKLVEHYDRWLEEYRKLRQGPDANLQEPFVWVGPKGFPFPTESEARFRVRLEHVKTELGGHPACAGT